MPHYRAAITTHNKVQIPFKAENRGLYRYALSATSNDVFVDRQTDRQTKPLKYRGNTDNPNRNEREELCSE